MIATAEPIADALLLDDRGGQARLGDSWADRAAVIIFLRHFGCMFCREHAADVQARSGEIEAAGASAVAVGLGSPADAAAFRDLSGVEFPLLVSADTVVHEAAGLRRGRSPLIVRPQTIRDIARATRKGHRAKPSRADMRQHGGTLVIVEGGNVIYAHEDRRLGDNAPLDDVIAALSSPAGVESAGSDPRVGCRGARVRGRQPAQRPR